MDVDLADDQKDNHGEQGDGYSHQGEVDRKGGAALGQDGLHRINGTWIIPKHLTRVRLCRFHEHFAAFSMIVY